MSTFPTKPHSRRGGGARSRKQLPQSSIGRYARRVEAGHAGLSGAVRDLEVGRTEHGERLAHPMITVYPAPKRVRRPNLSRAMRKRAERELLGGKADIRGWA